MQFKNSLKYIPAIMLLILLLAVFIGCSGNGNQDSSESVAPYEPGEPAINEDAVTEATRQRYLEREIRDYEGIRLDPSVGPRDNSISGIQEINISDYTLEITGLVETPLSFSYEEVLEHDSYRRLITLYCVEGWNATILWEGVRIMDLLNKAGLPDKELIVIFHCADGYTTSMPLSRIIEKDMLLAHSSNNITLPPDLGYPFIVVAEDRLGYKWARWVKTIEVSDELEYEGYWESRGFTNEAEVTRFPDVTTF